MASNADIVKQTAPSARCLGDPWAVKVSEVLESVASGVDRFSTPLCKYASISGSLLVMGMACLIIADVCSRLIFNRPFMITIELEQFMLASAVYLSVSWAMLNDDHVRVDLFFSSFSQRMRLITESVFTLLSLFVFVIIGWQTAMRAVESYHLNELGDVTKIPVYLVLAVVVFGCSLMLLVLFRSYLKFQADLLKAGSRPWLTTLIVLSVAALAAASPWLIVKADLALHPPLVGLVALVALLGVMFLGFRIALAMAFVGIVGTWVLASADTSLSVVRLHAYESVADYFLCVVPFFVLMGMICFHSGLSRSAYIAAYNWLGHMPGGLAISTVAGCGCFAAICGDSMATAATMGSVSLPEMKKYHYDDSLATGALAAGGTLGILIPPSIGFIVYGLIAEVSVAKLFVAGILPGLLMAALFGVVIWVRCRRMPSLGPTSEKKSLKTRIVALKGILPVILLFIIVVGGIYSGIFTPTEAGAVGVIGALLTGLFGRERLKPAGLFRALEQSMRMTAMIFLILIGVSILGFFTVNTEIPLKLSGMIASAEVSRYLILISILSLYLVLGMVMNIIPMIMLTLPIIFPTVQALGFDPIWFGVITVIMMEMGQITPPVGINVFVIFGVAKEVPMIKIFRGIIPFLFVQLLVIVILVLLPSIATYLPSLMKTLPSLGG